MLTDTFKNITFVYPFVLGALGLIPILVFWYYRNVSRQHVTLSVSSIKKFTVATAKQKYRHLPFAIRLFTIVALIIALARPQHKIEMYKSKGDGIDIILCMDISGSMGSPDIPPSRMEVAKEVAEKFVLSRPTDRMGLVVFAGEAFTQCPLTADKSTLIYQIQSLKSSNLVSPGLLPDGTVIGEGLATAVDRLSNSSSKTKIIILLTDGKEDAPKTRLIDPITALELAKAKRVKVYSIGVGAKPTSGSNLSNKQTGKRPAVDFIDEALLKRIAKETGGLFFRAMDKQALQETYNRIDQLEKTTIETIINSRYKELFLHFVLASLLFLILELLLRYTLFKIFS
jgi:Ca-activated chloride channel homolog